MNLSVIEHQLDKTAYSLFISWVENATKYYPDLDFAIVDESILVEDLKDSIKSSLKTLFEPKYSTKRLINGWEIGFCLGYIESNLNEHWYSEYIKKRSEVYKQAVLLNAIKHYLETEELAKIRILEYFKELINRDINLKEYDFTISDLNIDIKKLKIVNSNEISEGLSIIDTSLEKLRALKIFEYAKIKSQNFMPNLDKYFTNHQIKELISKNEGLEFL